MMRLRLVPHAAPDEEFGTMDTSILLAIVSLPLLGALCILLIPEKRSGWSGLVALIASLMAFGLTLRAWPAVEGAAAFVHTFAEVPGLPLSLAIRADRLGIFFAALITLVGAAVAQYARYYFKGESVRRFWFLFMIFQSSMLGLVLAESLLLLFIFWEMTTISSALLIAHDFQQPGARAAASLALMITAAGGLCLLTGIVLLAQFSGTDQFQELVLNRSHVLAQDAHRIALVFLLIGAFTKSAQFPFHFWLPGAMAAPIPISAYLHSATMVKAGIILLARLFPVFSESNLWQPILGTVGLVTFVVGSWNAFRSADMKKLLAHSTVAYLGVLTAIYGYSRGQQVQGELLHIANHTFYKSSLFLLLGWFEKVAGTRDINLLDREIWYRRQPLGALLFCTAGLSIVGGPFLLSYTAKDLFFTAVLTQSIEGWLPWLVLLGSILTVAFSIKLVVATFWGKEDPDAQRIAPTLKVSRWLLIIPALLILPQIIGGLMVSGGMGDINEPLHEWPGGLAFWDQLDVKTFIKFIIFAGGFGLYFSWRKLQHVPLMDGFLPLSLAMAQRFLHKVSHWSHRMQDASYQSHISIILLASFSFAIGLSLLGVSPDWSSTADSGWEQASLFIFPALLVVSSSLILPFVRDPVLLFIVLGLGTFGVALFYIAMRAPDLAMTQLLVDTLGLIVLLIVFHQLRRDRKDAPLNPVSIPRVFVSLCGGLAAGIFVFLAAIQPAAERIGQAQLELSLPLAHGRNVVNVILVDMRAMDTLGEVMVLAIAALGVVAILQRSPRHGEDADTQTRSP
jgi:NADH:ubiquinone oxidoreductase subunit 5 (subunit L)/multisubunit Na+/H+ antiporter MnhA subunit